MPKSSPRQGSVCPQEFGGRCSTPSPQQDTNEQRIAEKGTGKLDADRDRLAEQDRLRAHEERRFEGRDEKEDVGPLPDDDEAQPV